MTATLSLATANAGHMRSLNVLRDLPAVADLIELCFSSTLDPEGRNYIDQMRRNGRDSRFLSWAPRVIESVSLPLSGFVWEDNGRIVGNVSLIPFFKNGQRTFLIANVATHPDYRRQGIARALTEAAMRHAREKRADAIWLHVRDDNRGAITLYEELGFTERARRTSWYASSGTTPPGNIHAPVSIQPRLARDWQFQSQWLERIYPSEFNWYFTQNWNILKPGLLNDLYRFMTDINVVQWSAYREGKLEAVLSCQQTPGHSDHLWLAMPRKYDPDTVTMLLQHGRRLLSQYHSLTLEFPAGVSDETIRMAGFVPQRTLVWMDAPGTKLSD
jgi:ribosomal protein S18 acetylase RimI-like enzyme